MWVWICVPIQFLEIAKFRKITFLTGLCYAFFFNMYMSPIFSLSLRPRWFNFPDLLKIILVGDVLDVWLLKWWSNSAHFYGGISVFLFDDKCCYFYRHRILYKKVTRLTHDEQRSFHVLVEDPTTRLLRPYIRSSIVYNGIVVAWNSCLSFFFLFLMDQDVHMESYESNMRLGGRRMERHYYIF